MTADATILSGSAGKTSARRSTATSSIVADGQRATRIYLLSPEYVAPGIGQFYFSARGRISRAQYWLRFFLPVLLISLVLDGIAAADKSLRFLPEVFQLLVLWPGIAVLIKRIHDRNKSGWLVWLLYVPLLLAAGFMIAGVIAYSAGGHGTAFALGAVAAVFGVGSFVIAIWFFVEFGCMRGTVGANPYGADPVVR